jgi:hypothetical protein
MTSLRAAGLAKQAAELIAPGRAQAARDRALQLAESISDVTSETKVDALGDFGWTIELSEVATPTERLETLLINYETAELASLSWLEVEVAIADITETLDRIPLNERLTIAAKALTLRGRLYLETADRRHLAWPDLRDGLAIDYAAGGHSRIADALRAFIPTLPTADARTQLFTEFEGWLRATPDLVTHPVLNAETGLGLGLVQAASGSPSTTIGQRLVRHATVLPSALADATGEQLTQTESTARLLKLAKRLPTRGNLAPVASALFETLLADKSLTPLQRSEAHAYLSLVRDDAAQPIAAEADLRRALEVNAANEWARVELASRLILAGRMPEGIELATRSRAGEDASEHPFADQQLAIAAIVGDAGEEAIASALQALASHTKESWPASAKQLGAAYHLLIGDPVAADRMLSEVDEKEQDFILLARVRAAKGDRVGADAALQAAQRKAMRGGSYATAALAAAQLATRSREVGPDDMFIQACDLAERACVQGATPGLHLRLAETLMTRAGVPESDEAGSALRLLAMMHLAEATRIRGFVTSLLDTPWAIARHEQFQSIANDRIFESLIAAASSAPQQGERAVRLAAVYAALATELVPLPADVHEAAWRRTLRDGAFGRADASLADGAPEHCKARAITLLRDALAAGFSPADIANRAELAPLVPLLPEAAKPEAR